MKKYLLILTNGYNIEVTEFDLLGQAQKEMEDKYNEYHPEDNIKEYEELSYLGENDARLFANGHDVYVWKIHCMK